MDKSLVFLNIFCILRDMSTNVTSELRSIHSFVIKVHSMSVKLVILQVAFSDTFVANITKGILRGRSRLPNFIVMFQKNAVKLRMLFPVMGHLLSFSSFNKLRTLTARLQTLFCILIHCFDNIQLVNYITMLSYFVFL